MRRRFHFVPAALLVLTFFVPAFLEADGNKRSTAIARAKLLINDFRTVGNVPGIAVAVGHKNEVLWETGFGLSDLETNVAVDSKTRFRLGSVSKLITIAAAMRLTDRGVLSLDIPLSKYLPSLPGEYGNITVRQLAGHLGGVRHYKPEDFQFDVQHSDSVKDSLKIFTGDRLVHEPGTKYLYSTFGFVLLSAAIEAASGKEFLKVLEEEVFRPLRMRNSGPDFLREIIPHKTRYYERGEGKIRNARYEDPSYKWGAAGMVASAGDLVRFGMAHLQTGYLTKAALEQIFTSQKTSDGKETGVGVGWRIGSDWQGRKIYHHAGNISGGRSVLVLYPDHDLAIAFHTNVSSQPAFVESTAQLIAENFLPQNGDILKDLPRDLAGVYELSGMNQEKPYTARLELHRSQSNYRGTITGSFPLIESAIKNGFPAELRVSSVWRKDNARVLLLASPFGILEMIVEKSGNTDRYRVDEGPAKFEGEMKRVRPESSAGAKHSEKSILNALLLPASARHR